MNPYQFPVCCEVCGEKGMARSYDAVSQWLGGFLYHSDPQICAENIRRQKEEEKRKQILK